MATYRMVLFGPLVATQGRTAPGEARHWLLQLNAPDTCRRRWPFNSGAGQQYLLAGTVPTAAFFVERRVTRELGPKVFPAGETSAPVKA